MGAGSIPTAGVNLAGQVALVTGAGRGIGQAMALALAKAGASVAVAARSEAELAETVALVARADGRAVAVPADVADEDSVQQMVGEASRQLGPIDLLVNNAGLGGNPTPYWEMQPADWWRVIEVNVKGIMLCSQAVLPSMIERKRGRIVSTGSHAGVQATASNLVYSISKTAVLRFSEALALQAKPYGISVFAISPGLVHTAMTERQWQSQPSERRVVSAQPSPDPTNDWSPPELAGQMVVYIASGGADVLTGRFIHSRADDVQEMVERAGEIERDDLYTLRVRKLA